jgi:succinyl-diaminopimelate desuccinylase
MRDEIKQLLTAIVGLESVYPSESNLCNYIAKFFTEKGFFVGTDYISKDRFNIVVSKKENSNAKIALYAHIDTVGVVNGWTKSPFELSIEEDKAFGLGAFDMKGGMVANIMTFLDPQIEDIKLIFCVDEENISEGAYSLLKTNLLKGIECIISPEPAFKYGMNGITIGRTGHPLYQLTLNRESCHFMFYEVEKDLNLVASEFITKIKKVNKKIKEGNQFIYVNKYKTENKGMSVPDKVFIEFEVSLLPGISSEELLLELNNILNEVLSKYSDKISGRILFKDRKTPFLEAYRVELDNLYHKALMSAVETVTGDSAKSYFRSSVGDDNVFANNGITVLGIGPEGDNAHAPDEWVSISSIEKLINIQKSFILKF